MKTVPFNTLLNETLTFIKVSADSDVVTFVTRSGKTFQMYHEQECCENVQIEEIHGNLIDLLASPINSCSVSKSSVPWGMLGSDEYGGIQERTFYKLSTIYGSVTIRWLGTSNGYTSTAVQFYRIK